jgi:hypothetical protein
MVGVLGLALLAAFVVVNFLGGDESSPSRAGHGHGGGSSDSGTEVVASAPERAIGPARVARAGGGEARLQVFGNVALDAELPGEAVPAGAPLRLVFDLGAEADAAGARLVASTPAPGGAPPNPVALDRRAAFLLNRRTGDLVLPSGATGTAGVHGGHGGGASTDPGAGLAALSPGGGFAWAAKLPGGADGAVAEASGRFLAVSYADEGRVELVDLLRRTRAGDIAVGERDRAAGLRR